MSEPTTEDKRRAIEKTTDAYVEHQRHRGVHVDRDKARREHERMMEKQDRKKRG
jgi:hypothetical protein